MTTRLALIGCGNISSSHRAGFDALGDRLRVTTAVDLELERAQDAAHVLDADHACTDFQHALPHCDAVLIALPHHLHHRVGMACLQAGKHILMEKPMANSGQLFSHGCHFIDILLHFLGEPVSGVHVDTNFGTPWMEREGTSDVSLRFASGAVGYHGGTWGAMGTRLGYAFHAQ